MRRTNLTGLGFILPFAVVLSGCANWALKDKCDDTNWFEYSQGVAFEGRYVDQDAFIKECRKVERVNAVQVEQGFKLGHDKMCHYDEIFLRAKTGIPIFFNFCDNLDPQEMRASYALGLQIFCTPDKGYSFGKSGKVYSNICIAEQELDFLPRYNQGRKEYLADNIATNEKLIVALEEQQRQLKLSESEMSKEISVLPKNASDCSYKFIYDDFMKKEQQKFVCEEADHIRKQRTRLTNGLNGNRDKQNAVREDILKSNRELSKLKEALSKTP